MTALVNTPSLINQGILVTATLGMKVKGTAFSLPLMMALCEAQFLQGVGGGEHLPRGRRGTGAEGEEQ
jgi:hypothetical protein